MDHVIVEGVPDAEAQRPCPECEQGKCGNCNGTAWDNVRDEVMGCPCSLAGHGGN